MSNNQTLDDITSSAFELMRGSGSALALRLDDIGASEDGVIRIMEQLLRAGLCINLEVIPLRLDPEMTDVLRSLRAVYADSIEVHQHGWSHTNHEPVGKKQEFGPARPFAAKVQDMERGLQVMKENLPELFFPVFCPPWNRIDAESLRGCAKIGYRAISAFKAVAGVLPAGMADLSATVDWRATTTGGDSENLAQALDVILSDVSGGRDTIIMLHPHLLNEASLRSLMRVLEVAGAQGVPSRTFSNMLVRRAKLGA